MYSETSQGLDFETFDTTVSPYSGTDNHVTTASADGADRRGARACTIRCLRPQRAGLVVEHGEPISRSWAARAGDPSLSSSGTFESRQRRLEATSQIPFIRAEIVSYRALNQLSVADDRQAYLARLENSLLPAGPAAVEALLRQAEWHQHMLALQCRRQRW